MNLLKKKIIELFSLDVRSLALLRVFLALGIFSQSISELFTILSYTAHDVVYVEFLLLVIVDIFAFFLLFGYRTRVVTIFSLVLLVLLHVGTMTNISNTNHIIYVSLFWGMFLPLGTIYSVDSIPHQSQKLSSYTVVSLATVGYLIHMMLLCVTQLKFGLLVNMLPFIIALMALLPSWFWNRVSRVFVWKQRPSITVYYDFECGFCYKTVHFIKIFLFLDSLKVLPAYVNPEIAKEMEQENSWIVVAPSGKHTYRFDAFITLLTSSFLFRCTIPLLRFTPFHAFGEVVYKLLSSHRKTFCPIRKPTLYNTDISLPAWANILAGFSLFFIILWNVAMLLGRI